MKIIGAVIAGGQSTRMGGDEKAFLTLAGKGILDLVIGRFEPQVDQLVINANGDAARFSDFGLQVVPDVLTSLTTPLAGLHAALKFTAQHDGDILVTCPSDTPFLPIDLSAQLISAAHNNGAAIAVSGAQQHYIVGAWKIALLNDLETVISRDAVFRVKDWVARVSASPVKWPDVPLDPFFNVNTRDDLRAAELIVRTHS
jgi:molybdenum cofactor guanylyltransferase